MIKALNIIIVPLLRARHFKGSFPHFRRIKETQIDLLTFQFDRNGGGFVIEISKCPPDGITTAWGEDIPGTKVTAWDTHPNDRLRLQPGHDGTTKDWFRFDQRPIFLLFEKNMYERVAKSVIPFINKADAWWNDSERTIRNQY